VTVRVNNQACALETEVDLPAHATRNFNFVLPSTPLEATAVVSGTLQAGAAGAGILSAASDHDGRVFATLGAPDTGDWTPKLRIDPGAMPTDWRALGSVSVLAVDAALLRDHLEWSTTLTDWMLMGGGLVVAVEQLDPGVDWLETLPLRGPLQTWSTGDEQIEPLGTRPVGLGTLAVAAGDDLRRDARRVFTVAMPRMLRSPSLSAERARAELAPFTRPPYGSLAALLVLFVLLVGPAGWLYWIRRRGRPFVYLAWSMAGALLFSGSIACASLYMGISPLGSARSLRVLDQRAGVELDFHQASVFPPMDATATVRAPSNASVAVVAPGPPTGCRMRVASDVQSFEGLLAVRDGNIVDARWIAPTRGSLEARWDGDVLLVANHLGVDLNRVVVAQGDDRFVIDLLPDGAVAPAQRDQYAEVVDGAGSASVLPLAELSRQFAQGRYSRDWFVADAAPTGNEHPLLAWGLREVGTGAHFILGTLP
jgi:hypothetical protein